ncbi:hypothetical protein A8B98_19240 [Hymenobacter sp. UV11]|nr:hypothetical protein A8B98_19240 [Hymenobacter sp. UV11]
MSEIALISVRKSRLEVEAQAGDKRASQALKLAQSPNQFLSTVQIGITLVGILTGAFGEASLTRTVAALVARLPVPLLAAHSEGIALVLVVFFITYLSVVVGELLPKRIGLANPEGIAKWVAGPMTWLARLASPFIWLLSLTSDGIIKLLGIKGKSDGGVTEEEINALVRAGTSEGVVQEIEQGLVQNVFSLGDRHVGSLMTSRPDLVWLDVQADVASLRRTVLDHKSPVYPLAEGSLDHVLGTVRSEDLLSDDLDQQLGRLRELSREALYLPASSKAYHALELFRKSGRSHALVVNEFGSVLGLLTIQDIFDALVDDLVEEPSSPQVVRRDDGSYLIDAQLPFDEFAHQFQLTEAERQGLTGFHTLGGLLLHELGAVPKEGEHLTWYGHYFEAVDTDHGRIDKILYLPKPGTDDPAPTPR